jgi:hypothetical protein
MSDNPSKDAINSVASFLRRQIAHEKIRRYCNASECASANLEQARAEERYYELENAAAEYVGNGGAFSPFGNITDRERDIAIRAARYVLFGRTG